MQRETDFGTYSLPWKNEKGYTTNIPALDPRWCEDREFTTFFALKCMEKVRVDSWCSNTSTLIQDCKWLLRLPHHKFWSFIVYGDKSFHEMLDSYLINCPRYSEPELMNLTFFSTKNKLVDLQTTLHRKIFLVCLRMSTRREKDFVMSSEYFGKLIYDNFLFDVPRVMDLCSLYGQDNERTVTKIVEHIFKSQPKYYDNVKECCDVLSTLLDKCEKSIDTRVGDKVQLLTNRPNRYDDRLAFDAVFYVVDVVYTLSWFVKFCPKSMEIFHENGLTDRFPSFYENTYPILYEIIPSEGKKFSQHQNMLGRLGYFEKCLTNMFRDFICRNSLDYLIGDKFKTKKKPSDEYLEDFLNYISHALDEKHFAAIYNVKFPFAADVKALNAQQVEIDPERLVYFTEAFASLPLIEPKVDPAVSPPIVLENKPKSFEDNNYQTKINGVKEIRDIFPDLSEDFVEKVLSYFNNSVERVIDALITNNLPEELSEMMKNDGFPCDLPPTSSVNINLTFDDESNFDITKQTDYDEWNEMNADLVPLTNSKKRGLVENLEDKNAIKNARAVYDRYQLETPDSDADDELNEIQQINIYDDEYDDTYDGHNVNVEGDTLADEVVASYYRRSRSNVEEEDSEDTGAANKEPKVPGESGNSQNWKGNYTGGRDRQNKERHKGRYAHHDRKDRALTKHSKGFGFY